MTLRDKAKSLFKRRASRDDTLSKSYSKESHERWLSNVYQPGEPMPRPKYRRPPEKAHKAKLDAFSFAEAWRKKSFQSQHSPMGTRQPSRRNSFVSTKRRSIAARSSLSRNASVDSQSADKSGVKHKDALGAARAPKLSTEAEEEGDGDVGNGESRRNDGPHPVCASSLIQSDSRFVTGPESRE